MLCFGFLLVGLADTLNQHTFSVSVLREKYLNLPECSDKIKKIR